MNNNINKIENSLRSIAKRCKSVTFSTGLVLLYLMLGINAFSEEINTAVASRQEIVGEATNLERILQEIKAENSKKLEGAQLELVQLMEQGDQVVKSPWASWQFGMNYIYEDWGGEYKGRGDKQKDVIYKRETGLAKYTQGAGNRSYGTTSLNILTEPIASIPVDAAVTPKYVNKEALNINLPTIATPTTPALNVLVSDPFVVKPISIPPIEITPETPSPNLAPFSDFTFLSGFWDRSLNRTYTTATARTESGIAVKDDSGKTFWAGYNPSTNSYSQGYGVNNITGATNVRPGVLIYLGNGSPEYSGVTVHVAGNTGGAGNVGMNGGTALVDGGGVQQSNDTHPHEGQIAFHLYGKNAVKNSTINMYGKSNAFSLETWQMHDWEFSNIMINIHNKGIESGSTKGFSDENIVFNIYPSYYWTTNGGFSNRNRGKFIGNVNADLNTRYNIVYSVVGNSGSFTVDSDHGTYNLEGAKNTMYSGLGYQANYGAFVGNGLTNAGASWNGTPYRASAFKPYLNFDGSKIVSSGDENIIMFFADTTKTSTTPYLSGTSVGTAVEKTLWDKSVIGIYQGEIKTGARIGTALDASGSITSQTAQGNTGDNKWVEKNVGIFAASGQRDGIKSTDDLGAEAALVRSSATGVDQLNTRGIDFSQDVIHSLQINGADFVFGKYSKNGVMLASKNGTVLDVLMPTNLEDAENNTWTNTKATEITQTKLTDYGTTGVAPKSSVLGSANEAGTGTIIALSQGKWGDNGSNSTMSSATKNALTGLSSEINIGVDVELSGRYHKFSDTEIVFPIAYAATGGGVVNAKRTTTALGYGSIIGYATGQDSVINTEGNITAVDANAQSDTETLKLKWTNIGGFASNGGVVNLGTGTTTNLIHGIAGYAEGTGSVVNIKGTNNTINTGAYGALIANKNGKVVFEGGKITHKDNSTILNANDHDGTTPFFATNNGQIHFTGATTLDMHDGVLITGDDSDYSSAIGGSSKYQGVGNVTVNIYGSNVALGSFNGLNLTWDDSKDVNATFQGGLPGMSKFNGGKVNLQAGATYKTILINGNLDLTAPTVALNNSQDLYNGIQSANELITIKNTTTVSGNVGSSSLVGQGKAQGLSMGNIDTATQILAGITPTNTTSGFVNEGTINLTGGTATNGIAGMNVSYGTIQNKNSVSIDTGAGLYGTNGSKLVNESTGTINVLTSGVGIAGVGTGQSKQTYGTDDTGTAPTVEIENHGKINVAGDNAIGIFAKNNTGAARNRVTVKNDAQLTVGTKGVGIAVISETPNPLGVVHGTENGGTLTATATGTGTDIITGTNGIGIFAKNSDVSLTGGDYIIETKDDGVGIFASGNTNITGNLDFNYNGANTKAGMGIVYDQKDSSGSTINAVNNANIKLTNMTSTTGGMIGVYTTSTTGTLTNNGTISGTSVEKEFGIVSNGADIVNTGKISLGNATTQANANVGVYSKAQNTLTNTGDIVVGDNAIGVYGYGVNHNSGTITAGDNGVGIYTTGRGSLATTPGTSNVSMSGKIIVGTKEAVGIYAVGEGQDVVANTGSSFTIGDNSFAFVNVGKGNRITSRANATTLGNDTIFIYQNEATGMGTATNYTALTSTGDRNYGMYGNGAMENRANINFAAGTGNVGVYSTGGTATNYNTINVSGTNLSKKEYGIGMATGYYNQATHTESNQGKVVNRGIINVSQANSIGMYAIGTGSVAENYGDINLSSSDTVGMYIDRGATGINWGTIQTTASGLTGVKGIYLANGSYIKNYGTININATDVRSAGIWSDTQSEANIEATLTGVNPVTGLSQTGTSSPETRIVTASDEKTVGGITIQVPPKASVPTVTNAATGEIVPIIKIDTNIASPDATVVNITTPTGLETLDLTLTSFGRFSSNASAIDRVGMYVDTSGINYTNPIQGLSTLTGLTNIDLYFGTEATRYTNAKAIEIGDNILKPYNDELASIVTAGTMLNAISASLTWKAQPTKDATTGLLDKVYLVKIPYTAFSTDKNTYNFMAGIEERYDVASGNEKKIFDKLNDLGKGEAHIFTQAIDEMKGHQYGNVQQRIQATGRILDKEFDYLKSEWRTASKDSNKIKVFGTRGEYKTDTAGIIDYKNHAYGVAYVGENETVKLGNSSGWYTGIVHNTFKFKDIGNSEEEQLQARLGLYKTTAFDDNGSLAWTISGETFAGYNKMDRKFWVVDEVFNAKSKYWSYGVGLENELAKTFRLSEDFSLKGYGALKLEYGRFQKIKEKDGEIRLEVKSNDYISVKPEIGAELAYKVPVATRSFMSVGLGVAYENELGQVAKGKNKARVGYTTAGWYNLEGEKEDRRGNVRTDLKVGFDNEAYGITANIGYDTKGQNVRGGLGLRVIF